MSFLKLTLLFILFAACSQAPFRKTPEEPLVSVDVALDQARSSYLRGRVEESKKHHFELQQIMDTDANL